MLTCKLFHITYNAIVLSGKNPKVKPATKPDGIACNFESLLKIRRSKQDISWNSYKIVIIIIIFYLVTIHCLWRELLATKHRLWFKLQQSQKL